jgi:hypothetical protein
MEAVEPWAEPLCSWGLFSSPARQELMAQEVFTVPSAMMSLLFQFWEEGIF